MIRRLPSGTLREQHRSTSATKLHGIVERLQDQGFCGWVELRWPDCEGVLILPGDMRVLAVFQGGGTDVRGQDAMRQIIGRLEQRRADVQIIELPLPLGPLLGALSGLEPLHTGLHTAFVDLRRLVRRLERERFRGMVVVEGPGWWAFLPCNGGGSAGVYYDGHAAVHRPRGELIDSVADAAAEIEVWAAPYHEPTPAQAPTEAAADEATPQAPTPEEGTAADGPPATPPAAAGTWHTFRGADTFIVAPALRPDDPSNPAAAELVGACGPLALELARVLDGTHTLDQAVEAVGGAPETVEPILLYMRERKWIYRYVSRRRPGT
ncbi:MAG: hypothetical protein QN163_08705 [Armatimonadota bacterium]|nr:hypothetical protein [Armatimonadota bacterium]MDR5696578.1 hypothetical protein [Armatimonadota bacterium]